MFDSLIDLVYRLEIEQLNLCPGLREDKTWSGVPDDNYFRYSQS